MPFLFPNLNVIIHAEFGEQEVILKASPLIMRHGLILLCAVALVFVSTGCREKKGQTMAEEFSFLTDSIGNKQRAYDIDSLQILVADIRTDAVCYQYGRTLDSLPWHCAAAYPVVLRGVVYLAVMEQGDCRDDALNTGTGVFVQTNTLRPEKPDTIRDWNWKLGGSGMMTVQNGFIHNSDITAAISIEKYLPDGYASMDSCLKDQGLRYKETFTDYSTMQQIRVSPEEMLKWLNAISKKSLENYSETTQAMLQEALRLHVTEGVGKSARSELQAVSLNGMNVVSKADSIGSRTLSFIGYFPSESPKYSIYVECHKNRLPASVGIPSTIARHIAEWITEYQIQTGRD